jgi:hypothetical protein
MRTYVMRPDAMEPFEIGAFLLAVLAFPAAQESDARVAAAFALCNLAVAAQCAQFPDSEASWRKSHPEYFDLDDREIRGRLRQLKRRLRDRMIAARMSLGFFEEGITGCAATLPTGMVRLSLNELSKLALPQSGESNPENLEKRTWRASRGVFHIAAALQVSLRVSAQSPEIEALGYPLWDNELHRRVIEFAQFHEEMVLRDERFGVKPDELVHLRYAA